MADAFIKSNIRELPLFTKLPEQHLDWIAAAFRVMRLEPGDFLFRQGQPTQGMYLIVGGRTQLFQTDKFGRENHLAIVEENQYLNENALFKQSTETASLRALHTSTVLFLSRQRLMDVVSHHPEIKLYLPIPIEAERAQRKERVFQGQRENENVLLDTRRHWWAFVRKAWRPMLLALVLVIFASFLPSGAAILVDIIAIVIPFPVMVFYYLEWRNDHFIITDQRVIHIERDILTFRNSISEVPIDSIQEINADNITTDPFSRPLNYGTVEIKTAGEAGNMELTIVPDPDGIQDLIFKNRERRRQAEEEEQLHTVRATVDKVLGRNASNAAADNASVTQDASVTQIEPAPVKKSGLPFLPTRFADDDGNTVYRKNVVFWLRGTMLPGIAFLVSTAMFLLLLIIPGLSDIRPIGLIFTLFLMMIFGLWFYLADWDWRHDMYIVSDTSIQIIHMRPFWAQDETDQIRLESVDNVISEQSGIFQTLFNYGNVKVFLLGADTDSAKVFRSVSKPKSVQSEITRRQAHYRQKQEIEAEQQRRQEIEQYLSVYHETVSQEKAGQPAPSYFYPGIGQNIAIPVERPPAQPIREQPLEGFHAIHGMVDRVRPPKVPRVRRPN